MLNHEQVMRQALESASAIMDPAAQARQDAAITALRTALAEPVQEPVARFNWNEGKFEWLTKYDYYKHHMKPLYLHPAPAVPEVKAHQIRELVNQLRDIAIKYHDHQSLRDRLAGPVHDLWLLSIKREQKE